MRNIVDLLQSQDSFYSSNGATKAEILEAERALDLTFAKEYKDYLLAFGLASFQGHELTGLVKAPRLHVVVQTTAERKQNPHVSGDLYVVEIANIDGIVIWQKDTGEIFETIYNGVPTLICGSLCDYIARA